MERTITADEARRLLEGTTPGPWNDVRIGSEGDGSACSHEHQLCNVDGIAVAIITHDGATGALANDRLIGAAPDLAATVIAQAEELEALRCAASKSVAVVVPRFGVFAAILSNKHNRGVELPGGRVEDGESTFEAARREAHEELGVPVKVSPLPLSEFLHVFEGRLWCCTAYSGDLEGAHPRGSSEGDATWATRAELLAGTYGNVVRRILTAFDARVKEGA